MTDPDYWIRFQYTNHRGESGVRTVVPRHLWYGRTEHHPELQWFLKAFCVDRQQERDFPLALVINGGNRPEPPQIPAAPT